MSNIKVMLRLSGLVLPLAGHMIIAVLTGTIGFICAMSIPVLSVMALLQAVGMFPHLPLENILAILVISAILRGVLHYIEQACNHYIAFKILAILRDKVYTVLRKLAPSKLDGRDKGDLISLITNDIELLEVFYAHTISPVLIAILTSLILFKFFMHIHVIALIIACIAYLLVGFAIPMYVSKRGQKVGQNVRNETGDLSRYILESFRGIQTILQVGQATKRTESMEQKHHGIEGDVKSLKDIEASQMVLSQAVIILSSVIMFIALQVVGVSDFRIICGVVLMMSSFGHVLALSSLANHLLLTLSSARRTLSLLDEKPLIEDVVNGKNIEFGDICLNGVTFSYEDETILNDVTLTLEKNKMNAIVGKSGSGKSTILKLIQRFYDCQEGNITINGESIQTINTESLRNQFAYVTQETMIFHQSILENIRVGRIGATREEIIEAAKQASLHEFIETLPSGYDTQVDELGSSLSGGERQRIGLARALLSHAPCIVLDEPTSNLDVLNEGMILNALGKLVDKTIVIVSHRESTVKRAEVIHHIDCGRVS